jgi:hypothetical protein
MCLYLHDPEDYKIHRNWFKPITVYKIMYFDGKFSSISPFQQHKYNHFEQYWSKLESVKTVKKLRAKREADFEEFFDLGTVNAGFHSFLTLTDAKDYRRDRTWFYGTPSIHECEIPSFSKYYLGWESPHEKKRQHIVSNRIIVKGAVI